MKEAGPGGHCALGPFCQGDGAVGCGDDPWLREPLKYSVIYGKKIQHNINFRPLHCKQDQERR